MDKKELLASAIEKILDSETLINSDPIAYTMWNPAQLRCKDAMEQRPKIIIVRMPNGIGKTYVLVGIICAIAWPTKNALFQDSIWTNWPYRKQLRIVSTAKAVEDGEAIQTAIKELWPEGRYTQKRGSGKGYYSHIETDTGFSIDVLTYNQKPLEHESGTKGAVFMSEPPPRRILGSNLSRLRAGGPLYIEMTPLEYANYLKTDYEDKGALYDDEGKVVGKIVVVTGEVHENCIECTPNGGQLPHAAIEATIAGYPIEERELRRTGAYGAQTGLIYRSYGDHNEIEELEGYWEECWDRGLFNLVQIIDPHDRKPWAIGWKAVFPNDDSITVAEFPDLNQPMFHEILTSPYGGVEFYRHLTIETEKSLLAHLPGRERSDRRVMDPNFGNAPKAGEESNYSVKQMLARPCKKCRDKVGETEAKKTCSHKLFYSDPPNAIAEGHTIVRTMIGNPKEGIRPKHYHMKHCRNHCFGARNYGWKQESHPEKRGISEMPELVHKDYADLDRYFYLIGYHKYREINRKPLRLVKKKFKRRV